MNACSADPSSIDQRRRSLLLCAALASVTLAGACGGGADSMGMMQSGTVPPLSDPFAPSSAAPRDLPIIPLDQGAVDVSGVRSFSLTVQPGTTRCRTGVDTVTLGYNGALLGPALKLRTSEATVIRVRNNLGEATTAHWHGLFVPAAVDGGPHQVIAPGARWDASFTVANPASTCWFHPHVHGATGRQVVAGLAGLLIIDDSLVSPSTLPDTWGVDDLALVLQDKRFTASGQIDYALGANDRLVGYMGDSLLVNGVIGPVWQAPRQWVRLRLLNGCNARALSVRLSNAGSMLQVANEGGLLSRPVARAPVVLFPGERAEVLVDFSGAALGQEISLLVATVASAFGAGMGGGSGAVEVTAMKFRVSLPSQPNAMASPPATLPAAPAVAAGGGAAVRSFSLDGAMMGGAFTINSRSFDIGRTDFAAPANAVEVWRFFNGTNMAHPMHVHGVKMSLLGRSRAPVAAYEQGLRDTFSVASMETVTVAVQTAAAASPSPLVFHCHILEHEDAGMMGQFVTV
ncbi:MAG: multicopper oxidase domain-containing protein [Burkholderiaceae bacterium]|nr:multicopper oxidase domain-containing protein [Burkholderiaceae bacterium]